MNKLNLTTIKLLLIRLLLMILSRAINIMVKSMEHKTKKNHLMDLDRFLFRQMTIKNFSKVIIAKET